MLTNTNIYVIFLGLAWLIAMTWTTATTAINCAPVECVFSSPSSSVSSLEIATSRFLGYFQHRPISGSPILRRKDSLQLVTTIQSEFSDASTLAPSYYLDAFFEDDEDLADSLNESCSPDSQVTLIPGDVRYATPGFSIPPILHTGSSDFPNVVDDKLACRVRLKITNKKSSFFKIEPDISFSHLTFSFLLVAGLPAPQTKRQTKLASGIQL